MLRIYHYYYCDFHHSQNHPRISINPKVIFNIGNDSNALFSHYHISVDGIKDLQLMELASRKGSQDFVAGLAKCIERDSLFLSQ